MANDTHTTHPDANSQAFGARIHDAFDAIELSREAEDRMLANILDYAEQQRSFSYSKQAAAARGLGMTAKADDVPNAAGGSAKAVGAGGASSTDGAPTADGASSADGAPTADNASKADGAPKAEEATAKKTAGNAGAQPAAKKRVIPWKVIIPAAACLLLVLGVGMLVANDEPAVMPVSSTSQAGPSSSAEKADAPEGTAVEMPAGTSMMAAEVEEDGASWTAPYDPGAFNTEEYNAVEEAGFIATASRPLSTFAADVDTASYANLRRLINEGYGIDDVYDDTPALDDIEDIEDTEYYSQEYPYETGTIPKGAIRIEEMLNYFTYDYALPKDDDLFGTTVQMADCPWNPDTKLLVLGFATNPEVGAATAGRNLVFLIDTSGSMNDPNKMELLQDAFAELTKQLNENDRISIVTYSGYEEVVLDGASGSEARDIQRAIDKLRPEGSTNGEAGLKMAYDVAEANFIEGGVNRIILASDGDLNVGMSSESDLHDFVESKRDTGIYLSVLGFGAGNYKDNKMETLADAGNGNYHYIDCLEEAEKVFGTDLVANLVPLANDVKLQVEFNPAQVKGYRLIGYENRALADEDFRDDTKDAGDVGPGHQLTVAYEIVPIDSKMEIAETDLKYAEADTSNNSSEWLTCSMRYTPVQRGEGEGFVVEASKPREQYVVVTADDVATEPSNDWRFAAAVMEFGMVMRDSEFKGNATFESIENLLDSCDLTAAERKDFQRLVRKAH